jgi:Kdo2-lipid IVA lauroyltransferase/acyltransferase
MAVSRSYLSCHRKAGDIRLRLFMPRFWPTWSAIALSCLAARLPFPKLIMVGRALGILFRRCDWAFADIARRNLELCFPELSRDARETLVDRHFESLGIALVEMALAWWTTPQRLAPLVRVEGIEHLHKALARGRGVIVVSAHFTSLELAARVLTSVCPAPLSSVCWPTKNEALGYAVAHLRLAHGANPIDYGDIRSLVRTLGRNECVWYAPDQADQADGAQLSSFFGIKAASNVLTAHLARTTGAAVVPFILQRLAGRRGYVARMDPPLEGYPGPCPIADTERLNRIIEAQVRIAPEQYLWIQRRFRGLTGEYPDYYGGIGK